MITRGLNQLPNEEQLTIVKDFDSLDAEGKDYAISLVSQAMGKRFRETTNNDILEYHKKLLISIFSENCDTEVEQGFVSSVNGHRYRTNRDDQINFLGQYLYLQSDPNITEVFWTTEDGGPLPLTRDEFLVIFNEASQYKNSTIQKYWEKKKNVEDSQSHDELNQITWNGEQA